MKPIMNSYLMFSLSNSRIYIKLKKINTIYRPMITDYFLSTHLDNILTQFEFMEHELRFLFEEELNTTKSGNENPSSYHNCFQ